MGNSCGKKGDDDDDDSQTKHWKSPLESTDSEAVTSSDDEEQPRQTNTTRGKGNFPSKTKATRPSASPGTGNPFNNDVMNSVSMRDAAAGPKSVLSNRAKKKVSDINDHNASKVRYLLVALWTFRVTLLIAVLQGNLRINSSSEHAKRRHAKKHGAVAAVSRTSHVGTIGSARRKGTGL
jgi:hypothetical protein